VHNLKALKEQDLNTIRTEFNNQIKQVKANTAAQLQGEKDKTYQGLAAFKANLKVKCENYKNNLANNRVLNNPNFALCPGCPPTKSCKTKVYGKRCESSIG
jgi:hypothetical protein